MNIRLYKKDDFNMVSEWYLGHNQWAPREDIYTTDSTYILENEKGQPWICVIMYKVNCNAFCWIEGLISNPSLKEGRREAIRFLQDHLEKVAKELGYKNLYAMSSHEKITDLYESLGYKPTASKLTSFMKELE